MTLEVVDACGVGLIGAFVDRVVRIGLGTTRWRGFFNFIQVGLCKLLAELFRKGLYVRRQISVDQIIGDEKVVKVLIINRIQGCLIGAGPSFDESGCRIKVLPVTGQSVS